METLGELVGTVEGFAGIERPAAVESSSHAARRRAEHFDRLLRRAEADGTLETLFTPGYPPVRVRVAAGEVGRGEGAAVVVVDDDAAEVTLGDGVAEVATNGRHREVSLPFEAGRLHQRRIAGRTVVTVR